MKANFCADNSSPCFHTLTLAAILLGVCFLTYANSLNNGFLMDDLPNLIENADIGSANFLHLNFRYLKTQAYFRPGTHILNLITFSLFGTNPLGYHLTNILLLYAAGLALWVLINTIFTDRSVAFLTSLLFCIHPINGVLVNYKNATSYPFLIFAMTLSIINLIAAAETRDNKNHQVLSVLWFLAALSCHELVVLYPLYVLAIFILAKDINPRRALKTSLPNLVTLCLYLLFRLLVSSHPFQQSPPTFSSLTPLTYLAALSRLIFWYLSNLIVPHNIVLAWDTPLEGTNPWPWIALLALFVLFPFWLWKKRDLRQFLLALSWIYIGLIPLTVACFSRPRLGFVVEPHWLVFSSVGFFLLVALLLSWARGRLSKRSWLFLVIGLTLFYISVSFLFNHRWGNAKRYCQYWLTVSPNNFMPNYWLGHALVEEKEYAKAYDYFEKVLASGHRYYETYGSLGYTLHQMGKDAEALPFFMESLKCNPRHADTFYYMGMCYERLGQKNRAENFFQQALRIEPQHYDAQRALARLLLL